MKALVGAFNQEKALVASCFCVIVKTDGSFDLIDHDIMIIGPMSNLRTQQTNDAAIIPFVTAVDTAEW